MRSTLEEFRARLAELRELIAKGTKVEEELRKHNDSTLAPYLRVRRAFDYAGVVVLLYAHYEQFVENIVWAYADLMAQSNRYEKLPEGLKKRHRDNSIKFLQRNRIGKGQRYSSLTELGVVRNLFECANDKRPVILTREAVVHHESNLRHEVVAELFKGIGIDQVNVKAARSDALIEWGRSLFGTGATVQLTQIEEKLHQLVDRRNDIAHRGSTEDTVEADELIDFIEAYGCSLYQTVVATHLQTLVTDAAPLTVGEGPLRKGRVVVVTNTPVSLRRGQAIFMLSPESMRSARWGYIQNLRIDGTDVDEAPVNTQELGVEVSFECFGKAPLYALDAVDPLLWPPPAPLRDAAELSK